MEQAFNGAGDTTTPSFINLGCFWLFQLPLAWALSHHTTLGAVGVFAAIAASYSLSAVVALLCFRRGTWQQRKV